METRSLSTIHNHYGNKFTNWSLTPVKPILILGDSNLNRIPTLTNSNVQIDIYPGAQFKHAKHILRNTRPSNTTKSIILAFGINNKNHKDQLAIEKLLTSLLNITQDTFFPFADIYIPLLSISDGLNFIHKQNLNMINKSITSVCDKLHHHIITPISWTFTRKRIIYIGQIPRDKEFGNIGIII